MSVVQAHSGMPAATAHPSHTASFRANARPWMPGHEVTVFVKRPLEGPYYLATLDGRAARAVASSVPLKTGTSLRAVVVSAGARLELKLLNAADGSTLVVSDPDPGAGEPLDADANDRATAADTATQSQLDTLNARYGVPLTAEDHDRLKAAMKTVGEPRNMALAGLYLARLGLPLTPTSLHALYEAQQDPRGSQASAPAALNLSALLQGPASQALSATIEACVERMDQALNRPTTAGAAPHLAAPASGAVAIPSSGTTGANEQRNPADPGTDTELARDLLNVPAGVAVARHYGTLPVLISGQLLELQFVAFQHRETPQEQNPVRRLFMTLTTSALGRLQIAAQTQGNRLSITFTSGSAHATEALATHAHEVRELVDRLGWQVDSVVYSTGRASGAAQIAMTHTLLDNTMDQLL
jgi:flagellar hook-length control protein FliK